MVASVWAISRKNAVQVYTVRGKSFAVYRMSGPSVSVPARDLSRLPPPNVSAHQHAAIYLHANTSLARQNHAPPAWVVGAEIYVEACCLRNADGFVCYIQMFGWGWWFILMHSYIYMHMFSLTTMSDAGAEQVWFDSQIGPSNNECGCFHVSAPLPPSAQRRRQ